MMKIFKKGFTILELVIVIAVIAIIAVVMIPTFSGVIDKAQRSAALQIARTSLTNALSMSSTGSLVGDDADGNHQTTFLVNGYAFYYSGNQLNDIDYPGTGSSELLEYDTNYNAIIIAPENADFESKTLVTSTKETICSATIFEENVKAIKNEDRYYLSDGTNICEVFLNSNISSKVVIFTKFANQISEETENEIKNLAGDGNLTTEDSGTGWVVDFGVM